MVALAAVKYGDLSNQASKDYVFDIERFTSFEGNTGPYILYTIVRIKSILSKYQAAGKTLPDTALLAAHSASEKNLMLVLSRFNGMMDSKNLHRTRSVHMCTNLPMRSTDFIMRTRFLRRKMSRSSSLISGF